jgi:hypothetical protein
MILAGSRGLNYRTPVGGHLQAAADQFRGDCAQPFPGRVLTALMPERQLFQLRPGVVRGWFKQRLVHALRHLICLLANWTCVTPDKRPPILIEEKGENEPAIVLQNATGASRMTSGALRRADQVINRRGV